MLGTEIALLVLFLALGLGAIGGLASAYAIHWVLIHRMRGIDGMLRANYAIAKRAETRAQRLDGEQPRLRTPNTPEEILEVARSKGMLVPRGE